jgi:hypothetical protein
LLKWYSSDIAIEHDPYPLSIRGISGEFITSKFIEDVKLESKIKLPNENL